MIDNDDEPVLVQIVDVQAGREIAWGAGAAARLGERVEDIRKAIKEGVEAVSAGLTGLSGPAGWEVNEVSATFGITLTAEAGVLLSRAGTEATFEVAVTFQRRT